MKKIIEYMTVITENHDHNHDMHINKLLRLGWQPLGGLCYDHRYFIQVMVKYDETN